MSQEPDQAKSLLPHIVLAAIVIIGLIGIFLWLDEEPAPAVTTQVDAPVTQVEPAPEETKPELVEAAEPEPEVDPQLTYQDVEPVEIEQPLPPPEPLDVSDAAVKSSLLELVNYEAAASLLVNEDLLRRFVVLTENLAQRDSAPNHQILTPPEQPFRVYQQAGKEWIDAASYKRYSPYVEAFDSMDSDTLLALYQKYKPSIDDLHAELSDPEGDFDDTLVDAIDHLLDTPQVPAPVEVFSESVMYKYKDERLEALSLPQKHLLRTGPENMRRIKAKLREIKALLE